MKTQFVLGAISFALAVLITPKAKGAIVISGDPTAGTGVLEITQDVTLIRTTTGLLGDFTRFVFDEWVTSDGSQSFASLGGEAFSYTINSGPVLSENSTGLLDNFASTVRDYTPNDGYLSFNDITLSIGDTFTLKTGTLNLPAIPGFNPGAIGTFVGQVFLTDSSATRISDIVTVPEPSSILLLGSFSLVLLRRNPRP